MKFITLTENLKQAINLAERITGKNVTLPVLSNILLSTNKNQLHVLATDLELGIELSVSGKVEESGQVVIPAKTFADFLNNLTSEKITLESEKQALKVTTESSEALFQGINPEDFPIIPEVKTEKTLELDKNLLRESLGQILPSIGYLTTKPELNGVYFHLDKNFLKLVGTDSFRLAEKTISSENFKTNLKPPLEMIVPVKTIQEVIRISQEGPEDISSILIYPEVNQVQFLFKNTNEIRLVSRLINGQFPEYASIIPNTTEVKISVKKKELAEAVRLAGLFCTKINDIKFLLKINQKKLTIEAQDPSLGKSQNVVALTEAQGPDLEISFNYRFVLDGLNSLTGEEVILGFNKETSPALFESKNDQNFVYLLMPIKI
ncbi:MAG: Beta sliding clamp [Patescibacteria group bacterium]|nr:Beta sliding clamp [Patescibacteria group bacterium]